MSLHHVDGHGPPSQHATGFARIDDVEGGRPLLRDLLGSIRGFAR